MTTTATVAPPTSTDDPSPQRRTRRRTPSALGTYLGLGVLFVVLLFPVYFGLVGSFMGSADLTSFPPKLFPVSGLHPENYANALEVIPLGRQYLNSFVVAALVVAGQLVTSVCAAYALVFLPLRARTFWFFLLLSTMMIPWEAIIIPNYLAMAELGLVNTIAALALPYLAAGFGVFLMRQAFLTFPMELRDAARVDGVSTFGFLWRILAPLTRPSIAALGVWAFLSAWNMYFWPLLITQAPENQTIQIGITQLQSVDANDPGMVLAGVALALLPTLLLVLFGQRFIVRGLTAGAGR
ncbi:ABC transporter permease subunit [Auraticoccus sp. F435]|uniref:ABC transporter permease subunit n=1 Tax=Auraticoccus cholistanensis TaxID=2656650 RepID=A0A6A9USH3_9ACTN|nr:carbohydrate ABC transporter permease [Auraticoccus cholistanensis]MVA75876.1 ABC transporter permease subunit [Auraticoccus cholistanensis]